MQSHPNGARFSVVLLSRRSRRHPGTRYLARGLNALAGPGNEIECELVLWLHPEAGRGPGARRAPLRWARCVWRRGTVPIWWGVQLQSLQKGLAAEVYVREEAPYKGTAAYFCTLQQQHASHAPAAAPQQSQQQRSGAPGRGTDPSMLLPVTCVNLLHVNPKKASELMLSSHFQEVRLVCCGGVKALPASDLHKCHALPPPPAQAMRHVRRRLGSAPPVRVLNFDWHGTMAQLGEERAVEAFWAFCGQLVQQVRVRLAACGGRRRHAPHPQRARPCVCARARQTGLALGTMEPADDAVDDSRPARGTRDVGDEDARALLTAWPFNWRMRWAQQQDGLLRFNCADSLDRTNAATCFAMLPVLQEGLRLLGLQVWWRRACAAQNAAVAHVASSPPSLHPLVVARLRRTRGALHRRRSACPT